MVIISQFIRTKQAAAKLTPATPKTGKSSTFNETDINLDDLFAQLIDELRRLKSIHAETALNTKAGSGGAKLKRNKPKKTKKIYKYYKRFSHTENECWELHPELNPKNKRVSKAIPEEISLIFTCIRLLTPPNGSSIQVPPATYARIRHYSPI